MKHVCANWPLANQRFSGGWVSRCHDWELDCPHGAKERNLMKQKLSQAALNGAGIGHADEIKRTEVHERMALGANIFRATVDTLHYYCTLLFSTRS